MRGIILDTNVISEPKRPAPDPNVRAWFLGQEVDRLYLTSTVICELAVGIERMPKGQRRGAFERWLQSLVTEDFANRILGFDVDAALLYRRLVADALDAGRPPKMGDAQIAAVARCEGMAVATRDVADFEPLAVPVVNPWQAGADA